MADLPKKPAETFQAKTFQALRLLEPLLRALDKLEHKVPTAVQASAIPAILAGRDVLAAAQTGTGKTAAFALPLLQRLVTLGPVVASNCTRALVLVPTRELAEQVCKSFGEYGRHLPLRVYAAYGGVSINPQMMALRRGVDVLVATPGRLLDLHRQNAIGFRQVQTLVLDEADRLLDLGFAEEVQAICAALPKLRQNLLFSATFSDDVRALAGQLLRDPLRIEASPRNEAPAAVNQLLIAVDKKRKLELLDHLLAQRGWPQVLVFVKTRAGVDEVTAHLQRQGILADGIHGDKPQATRQRLLEAFKNRELRVLLATDVAARGLDIEVLPAVVNLDLPLVAQDYVHRIGRTGRAGQLGEAISLVSADEFQLLAAIEALTGVPLRRSEEPGFAPVHRVPTVDSSGQVVKKPKKPKKPKVAGGKL